MPIKILGYRAIGKNVWTKENSGRRMVASCSSKAMAKRIVRLLEKEIADKIIHQKWLEKNIY